MRRKWVACVLVVGLAGVGFFTAKMVFGQPGYRTGPCEPCAEPTVFRLPPLGQGLPPAPPSSELLWPAPRVHVSQMEPAAPRSPAKPVVPPAASVPPRPLPIPKADYPPLPDPIVTKPPVPVKKNDVPMPRSDFPPAKVERTSYEPGAKDVPPLPEPGAIGVEHQAGARLQPGVSLEWIGPATVRIGHPVECQIVIKNVSDGPVQDVIVRNRIPTGVTVYSAEPKPVPEGNVHRWDLGHLASRQEKRIELQLVPETKGDLTCQAWVTFTGTTTAKLMVREPKLMLKAMAPEKVMYGDSAAVTLTVSNPGDGVADQVKVKAVLPEGLEHARGQTVEFDLGNLGPNETRSVQLICGAKGGGTHKCDVIATAEGNLQARDQVTLNVTMPRIELEIAGPKLRYLDRPATYLFKVTNPGNAAATNVMISDQLPQGFKFVAASDGGRYDFSARHVTWFIGDLAPGQSRDVRLDVVAAQVGEHRHKAGAVATRGLKTEAELATRVEGLSALTIECVDLEDPIEVGASTTYEVRVTNTGSKTETNLKLVCSVPEKMELVGAKGPGNIASRAEGREIVFEPLPQLNPRADAVYRIIVKGTAAGDIRFRARIMADGLTEPVLKEESTKVYGEEPGM